MTPPDTRLPGLSSLRPLGPTPAGQEDPARVAELAHQFEALFLTQMLRQMRQSMALAGDDGEEKDSTFTAMTDTIDTQLAEKLSAGGGIGIAKVIVDAFERQRAAAAGGDLVTPPEAPRRLVPPTPVARSLGAGAPAGAPAGTPSADAPALPLPFTQKVTSAFGWRHDPFTGGPKFHKGVDVRAAYGQPVPAVADGRVVSAGPAGGYGLMVVVEHGSGIQTRYAHLSALDVRPGDRVAAGQEIGQVGQTGRSTGPHLHFEVLDGGRPVDPAEAAARFRILGELKPVGPDADSPIGRAPAGTAAEE